MSIDAIWLSCGDCGRGRRLTAEGLAEAGLTLTKETWRRFYCFDCRDAGGIGRNIIVVKLENTNVRDIALRSDVQEAG